MIFVFNRTHILFFFSLLWLFFIVAGERSIEREGLSLGMDEQRRREALEEIKKSWSYDAAKNTTLDYKRLEQGREKEREYSLGR